MTKMKCIALVCGMAVSAAAFAAPAQVKEAMSVAERIVSKDLSVAKENTAILESALNDEAFAARAKAEFGLTNSSALRMALMTAAESKSEAQIKKAQKFFADAQALVQGTAAVAKTATAKVQYAKSDMPKDMVAASVKDSMGVASNKTSADLVQETQLAVKNDAVVSGVYSAVEAAEFTTNLERHPELVGPATAGVCSSSGEGKAFSPNAKNNLRKIINATVKKLDAGMSHCKAYVAAFQEITGRGVVEAMKVANACGIVGNMQSCAVAAR